MIQEFVNRFTENKEKVKKQLRGKVISSYEEIVKIAISSLEDRNSDYEYDIDSSRIHSVDDGDYQGTILFVIAAKGYQPSDYWYVKFSYGSCSCCDTLQGINDECDDEKTRIESYITLMLHIIQNLKKME
jgi:hypothetical protein